MNKWDYIKEKYIDRKIKIIPIQENKKIPLIPKWDIDCSYDYMQVLYWYESNNNINWGIPCKENDLFVLDLDRHGGDTDGIYSFERLIEDLDIKEIDTMTQRTPSGGLHFIFQSDDDLRNVKGLANAFKDYPSIDLRNRNYILCEPSCINGKPYEFLSDKEPSKMPEKLKEFILKNATGQKSEHTSSEMKIYERPDKVEVGDRDNQLFSYIQFLYNKTILTYDEILCLALSFNKNRLVEPFDERTIEYKVKKAFEHDRGKYIFIKTN